ncbi:sugar ABC transporter ATP-binding protein (plasmid) [Bradyrhizobium sp. CB82]|uniref:sugar ABC transporter ATP-binding protein n=1 Tax=Bradyrhizobium sp. CB82 TaxID=3039159 RepID=UPI0024B27ECA|nr:sugar ABC transporter ATP-binding protein [Bradyrhizobium sp. CB82]WFU45967.1 sugar ABC transporter ATP-binding protein [Bradyrhizobium sp. CB82]
MSMTEGMAWELRNIRKTFGPVVANDDVSLGLRAGQIHGLVGENGSGKSTLIKTLCGAHKPDSGVVLCAGRPVQLDSPLTARALGIATVFQEFSLVPHLAVAENILLGRWPGGACRVDWRSMHHIAKRVLDGLGIEIATDALVRDLSKAQHQMIEIAKAMAARANLFILDEPTTALGVREADHLHDLLRRMRDGGAAILYISHRLDEVVRLADVVTVMRNGRIVSAADATPLDVAGIITLMIGEQVREHYSKASANTGEPLLEVRDISTERGVRRVSFTLLRGEVLGLGGMLGAGRSEIARALFGVDRLVGGEIRRNARKLRLLSPADAIAAGIALLAEDRKTDGLFFNFTGAQNITTATLGDYDHGLWLDLEHERRVSRALIERLRVAPQAEHDLVDRLSGGNQQKLLLGRWLGTAAEVFIFDEPTQGIDVGTKVAIYHLINELTRAGKGVILISSDDKELFSMSDRIAIVQHGRIARFAKAGELSKADLLETTAERMDS